VFTQTAKIRESPLQTDHFCTLSGGSAMHHLAALRQPLRLVVRRSDLVAFGVRQLQLDQPSA
jgi:hypothetical protein